MKNSEFTHLHVHNEFSTLDGVGTAEDYVIQAKELGFKALALTNHGNVDGLIKFQKACKDNDIIPISGYEGYIVPKLKIKEKGEKRGHVLLLIKNQKGWENILKMASIAELDGSYRKPRLDYELLLKHCEGLVITSACTSSFIHLPGGIELLQILKEKIKDDLYLEVQPLDFKMQYEYNKTILSISKDLDIPIIASNDCHYVLEEDSTVQEVLLAIQNKAKWNDPKRWKFDITDLYLKTADEMLDTFKRNKSLPFKVYYNALKRTNEIVEKCKDFKIEKASFDLPSIEICKDKNDRDFLRNLITKKLTNKIKTQKEFEKYTKRADEEFEVIEKNNYVKYFLIVWELVSWCKENDIMVGPGRGSVGGCLIAYLIGITNIDPIEHNLLFERFISPGREDLPDIDLDFEDRKRHLVVKHLEKAYGVGHVAGITTFMKMKGRMALRDVARVFEVNEKETDLIAKMIDNSLNQILTQTQEGIEYYNKYKKICDIALRLEGQIRGMGRHAAGIVISDSIISESNKSNLRNLNKNIVVNWDKYDSEFVGMLKLDVLGLSALSVLKETQELIKENQDIDIDFNDIKLDDPTVLENFALGRSVGCFQFGTYGLRQLCQDLKIDSFDLLATATALFRPAPLRKGLKDEFLRRRNEYEYTPVSFKSHKILKDTYDTFVYQEQTMMIVRELANFSWEEADRLRKVLDWEKFDEVEKFRDKFIKQNVLNEIKANKLWEEIVKFGGYGFNKSHAYAYTLISYYDMFCKVYFPAEFICATLTFADKDKKEEICKEAINLKLKINYPKIGKSDTEKWTTKKNELFMPFKEIKGIGDINAKKIKLATSNKTFNNEEIPPSIMKLLETFKAFDKGIPDLNLIKDKLSFSLPSIRVRKK